jgi:hypothetical protein
MYYFLVPLALLLALSTVLLVFQYPGADARVDRILKNPEGVSDRSSDSHMFLARAQVLELYYIFKADQTPTKDAVRRLTRGLFPPLRQPRIRARIVFAGKDVVLEPLLDVARDKSAGMDARYWALMMLTCFNDPRVLDAWIEFAAGYPLPLTISFSCFPCPWIRSTASL